MADRFYNTMQVAGLTDPGRVRTNNEDYFEIRQDLGVLLVCDGMGGHEAGEVASHMAAEGIADFIYEYDPDCLDDPDEQADQGDPGDDRPVGTLTIDKSLSVGPEDEVAIGTVREAVRKANEKIQRENVQRGFSRGSGMGTTMVGLWLLKESDRVLLFNVGDSRIYRFRDGELELMTRDHTLYQEWEDRGREGEAPRKNIILRALGPFAETEADVRLEPLRKGDIFVLCSDGLTGFVEDDNIEDVLTEMGDSDLEAACTRLIQLANDGGGRDNITVVLGRCVATSADVSSGPA